MEPIASTPPAASETDRDEAALPAGLRSGDGVAYEQLVQAVLSARAKSS